MANTVVSPGVPRVRLHQQPRPIPFSPVRMSTALALTDLCAVLTAVLAGFTVWRAVNPEIPPLHPMLLVMPVCAVVGFAFSGLYPGVGLTAVQHLRRYTRSITLVFLLLTATMFITREEIADSRGALCLAWAIGLLLAPLGRWGTSRILSRLPWWGAPAIVIGAGHTARLVIRNLNANRILAYRPIVCLDEAFPSGARTCEGIPVVGRPEDAAPLAELYNTPYVVIAAPGISREKLIDYLRSWTQTFPRILLISNLAGMTSLWTEARDLGGVMGLEIRQNLLNPWNQRVKRVIDIIASSCGLLLALPLLAVLALWIRRVSPASPFYSQEREGHRGRPLRVHKLRTMYPDAERLLEDYLSSNADAQEEWNRFCKLRHDPRILPGVGHFLRKTSLDELPQLWNVLKGEMSLVGPRPFPAYHNSRFDPDFRRLRTQVTPGLTGLWQVSARSDGDLDVQVSLDSYYIRNWSLWLDFYILFRTVRVVLSQKGSC
jgi:Undecaprenyl-phosphate galactose phosphotransferase WbaP